MDTRHVPVILPFVLTLGQDQNYLHLQEHSSMHVPITQAPNFLHARRGIIISSSFHRDQSSSFPSLVVPNKAKQGELEGYKMLLPASPISHLLTLWSQHPDSNNVETPKWTKACLKSERIKKLR